jgi:hypothetical protein
MPVSTGPNLNQKTTQTKKNACQGLKKGKHPIDKKYILRF